MPSLYREPRADELALLNALDNFSGVRNGLRKIAELRGDWAGIPMPLEGERLIIEPSYPNAAGLSEIGAPKEVDDEDEGLTLRTSFWSRHLKSDVLIMNTKDGKIDWGLRPGVHHLAMDLKTLSCSIAWGIEQESAATRTLAGLLTHHQFRTYMLTGMFMERSKRSGVAYLFRRLKPTVAIRSHEKDSRILCTLCMHPIAYYAGSWAGAMCPTDDVIAHLMLMRGDEHMLWRRSNQHAPFRPEAGL